VIVDQLDGLAPIPLDELIEARYLRYRNLGAYTEVATPDVAPPERPGFADRLRNLLDPGRWAAGMQLPNPGRGRDEPPAREEV
jgi:hypothetical protein